MEKYNGLTYEEVIERKKQGLINVCEDNISKSKKQIIMDHTLTYFNFINIFLAIIIISTGKWKNLTFMVVIIVNAIIGIIQEFKVKKVIDQLSVVTVKKVRAIRDGKMQEILVEDLVLDDIIYLESGEQIGTDCDVIESFGMEVNESLLTGESDSIFKSKDDELFAGSFVVAGSGYARVKRVGKDNYSTQLVMKAKHKNSASSEMKTTIEKIIKVLSIVIIPVGIILFISQKQAFPDDQATAIVKTVAGVVGMIPEGLVLLTSLSFILGVGKLARKKALIQEMEAIEALARVNILCLDKTGTITTGDLEVVQVEKLTQKDVDIQSIMSTFAHHVYDSNATQKSLQKYFPNQDTYSVLAELPFSSQRKMRGLTLKDIGHYVLGAPEFLVDDPQILKKAENYSLEGYRVLMLGKTNQLDVTNKTIGIVEPLAFVVMKDCIREDAKETLEFFSRNDVDVCILSGDNPITVSKVAKIAGLKHADRYIDASLLKDEEDMSKVVGYYRIFGRVKPEQKHQIIRYLQQQGNVVGMVGDGVNDVLALKDADCGIAMAEGSDAAKQAAHIVLLDSNFSSMKDIVDEGKAIIADIERVSSLYLTKTIYSTALCMIFALLQKSYPFTPIQLSLISGLAIGVPSFLLTLDRSSQLSSHGFLKHVISTAVPCALTMIIYMVGISYLSEWFHWNTMMQSTYSYLVAGFISFLVVFIVCLPYNFRRMIVTVTITIVFYLILLVMPDFFGIYPLWNQAVLGVIPLCISTIFVMGLLRQGIHYIYKLKSSHE